MASLMNSVRAASRLVVPAATRRRTSSSRSVSASPAGAGPAAAPDAAHQPLRDGRGQHGLAAAAARTARTSSSRGASLSR